MIFTDPDAEVVLLTLDKNLRTKARITGIQAFTQEVHVYATSLFRENYLSCLISKAGFTFYPSLSQYVQLFHLSLGCDKIVHYLLLYSSKSQVFFFYTTNPPLVISNSCTRWVPGSCWTRLWMVAGDWLTMFVIVSGDLHWPDHPTWTKTDIDQLAMGIGEGVSDFLVPNGCINFW